MFLASGSFGMQRAVTFGLGKCSLLHQVIGQSTFADLLPLSQPAQNVFCVASTYTPVSQGPRDALHVDYAGDFEKAPLQCELGGGSSYNLLQAVHVGRSGFDLAADLVLFASFPRGEMIEHDINAKFFENIRPFTVDGPPNSMLNLFDNARRSFVGGSPRNFQLKCSQGMNSHIGGKIPISVGNLFDSARRSFVSPVNLVHARQYSRSAYSKRWPMSNYSFIMGYLAIFVSLIGIFAGLTITLYIFIDAKFTDLTSKFADMATKFANMTTKLTGVTTILTELGDKVDNHLCGRK